MLQNFVALDANLAEVEVSDEYTVGLARVYVTEDGRYLVREPRLAPKEQAAYLRASCRLGMPFAREGTAAERVRQIEDKAWKEAQKGQRGDTAADLFERLRYFLVRDLVGYGILDVPIRDWNVEEVFSERFGCGAGVVYRGRDGRQILETNIIMGSGEAAGDCALNLVRKAGCDGVPPRTGMAGITREGHRVAIAWRTEGKMQDQAIAVCKANQKPLTVTHLIESGTLSGLAASYLWLLNDACAFGLVTGPARSGRTTVASAIASMSRPDWRVLAVGETGGLAVPHRHSVMLDLAPWLAGNPRRVAMAHLVRTSEMLGPDLLLADGIRTGDAPELFSRAESGRCVVATMLGNDTGALLARLAARPLLVGPWQQALLWYVVQMQRSAGPGGKLSHRVASISEVYTKGYEVCADEVFACGKSGQGLLPANAGDLLSASRRVHDAAKILGVDPLGDMQRRMELLGECVRKKAYEVQETFGILSKYYGQ